MTFHDDMNAAGESLDAWIDKIEDACDRAREEGRAEERAAVVAWLTRVAYDEGAQSSLAEDIRRGEHLQ